MEEAKHALQPMRAGGACCYIGVGMLKEDQVMDRKASAVEHSNAEPVRRPKKTTRVLDPDEALERQIRQIERNFGPDWKW
jgi:hypothetical protein